LNNFFKVNISYYLVFKKAHGSFLGKNQDFLSRLARTAAASGAGSDGLLGAQHSRNFVFAAKEKDTASQVSLTVEVCGKNFVFFGKRI